MCRPFRPHWYRLLYPGLRYARKARYTAAWADNVSGFQPSENIVCLTQASVMLAKLASLLPGLTCIGFLTL